VRWSQDFTSSHCRNVRQKVSIDSHTRCHSTVNITYADDVAEDYRCTRSKYQSALVTPVLYLVCTHIMARFFASTVCSKKSDAKIEIIISAKNLIRIKYPLSSLNYHLSGANVANFNKIHCTVFEQQLFKKWSSKTEVSNMERSPYQFVRNTTSYSLCSKWSPFAQTFACLLCRPYVLCCWRISCLQTL